MASSSRCGREVSEIDESAVRGESLPPASFILSFSSVVYTYTRSCSLSLSTYYFLSLSSIYNKDFLLKITKFNN